MGKQALSAEFFLGAELNSASLHITGMICGYRVEEIANPLTRSVRYLDKGRKME